MGLVGYSDSEGSDSEVEDVSKRSQQPTKQAATKFVHKSEPHKIKVSLPSIDAKNVEDDEGDRPAKRSKTSGGLSGFNSFLPAPKKDTSNAKDAAGGSIQNKGKSRPIFQLKTGATPGFSREPIPPPEDDTMEQEDTEDYLPVPKRETDMDLDTPETQFEEPKPPVEISKKSAMIFKPLSVSRKPAKKSSTSIKAAPVSVQHDSPIVKSEPPKPAPKPSVSLFSMGSADAMEDDSQKPSMNTSYQMHLEDSQEQASMNENSGYIPQAPAYNNSSANSLDNVASDLNLSASARRQLFGRNGKGGQAINVMNYNMDQEYAANESLRQSGEQQVHNPVRGIAPGRHSLKQLVGAVAGQRDALEEHFAKGKSNKREAGSKYGW